MGGVDVSEQWTVASARLINQSINQSKILLMRQIDLAYLYSLVLQSVFIYD